MRTAVGGKQIDQESIWMVETKVQNVKTLILHFCVPSSLRCFFLWFILKASELLLLKRNGVWCERVCLTGTESWPQCHSSLLEWTHWHVRLIVQHQCWTSQTLFKSLQATFQNLWKAFLEEQTNVQSFEEMLQSGMVVMFGCLHTFSGLSFFTQYKYLNHWHVDSRGTNTITGGSQILVKYCQCDFYSTNFRHGGFARD